MSICIYCQKNDASTVDHVPPKGLFPKPRPSNLKSVPACEPCNKGFKNDDEYFLTIALEWAASESSDGGQIAQVRVRDSKKEERKGLWRRIFSTVRSVQVFTPSGLFLGNSLEFRLDGERIFRTVNRTIRGLYYKMVGTPLPVDAIVASMEFATYQKGHGQEPNSQRMLGAIASLKEHVIGRDTFLFRYFVTNPDSFVSFWYLEFYKRFAFLGTTRKAGPLSEVLAVIEE